MDRLAQRLYLWWLRFLRYANWIEMIGAHQVGNYPVAAWQSARIAELDSQIDRLSITMP